MHHTGEVDLAAIVGLLLLTLGHVMLLGTKVPSAACLRGRVSDGNGTSHYRRGQKARRKRGKHHDGDRA